MGVDFYSCANCDRTFPDCGYYFSCECGEHYCSDKCGGKQITQDESDEDVSDEEYLEEITTCIICRVETIKSYDMMQFLLKKSGLTYEEAVAMYRSELSKEEEAD